MLGTLAAGITRAQPAPAIPTATPPVIELPVPPLDEVIVETTEPRYVAPTRRDRIGRIWADGNLLDQSAEERARAAARGAGLGALRKQADLIAHAGAAWAGDADAGIVPATAPRRRTDA